MSEQLVIGTVPCDFMTHEEFHAYCTHYLVSSSFHHIVTLNPEMVMIAQTNRQFREAIINATIRVPDGSGMIWAHWYIRSQFWSLLGSLLSFSFRSVERITGVDAVISLSELAATKNLPIYLLGGTETQSRTTAHVLQQQFPQLTLHRSAHHRFSMKGPAEIITDIKAASPAILFVAYGAPYQSEWIEAHKHEFPSVRIAIGVGGAFAILSEELPRAPRFLRQRNIEWLWRLYLEPSRLPRIWQATVCFPLLVKHQKETMASQP